VIFSVGAQQLESMRTLGLLVDPNRFYNIVSHAQLFIIRQISPLLLWLNCVSKLQSERTKEATSNLSLKFWQEAGPIKCVQSRLKTLAFRDFHGDESEFAFLMFIAENAEALEKMNIVIELPKLSKPEELASKMMALDSARWASGSNKAGYKFARLGEGGGSIWNLKLAFDFNCSDPFLCL